MSRCLLTRSGVAIVVFWACLTLALMPSSARATCSGGPPAPILTPSNLVIWPHGADGVCYPDGSTCVAGQNVTLEVVPIPPQAISPCVTYTFQWHLSDGTDITTAALTADHTFAQPGSYTLGLTVSSIGQSPVTTSASLKVVSAFPIPAMSAVALALLASILAGVGYLALRR